MKLEDALFFSPKFKFEELDLTNVDQLIEAFEDRVEEFYFKPAETLTSDFFSFAKGVLVLSAVDFIGYFIYGTSNSDRIKKFCSELKSLRELTAIEINEAIKRINEDYRNGLIHEGRIKRLGQFGLDIKNLIEVREKFSMVNPDNLLKETKELFYQKTESLRKSKEDRFQFKKRFTEAFQHDVNATR